MAGQVRGLVARGLVARGLVVRGLVARGAGGTGAGGNSSSLPFTGVNSLWMSLSALMLVVMGAVLIELSRQRGSRHTPTQATGDHRAP